MSAYGKGHADGRRRAEQQAAHALATTKSLAHSWRACAYLVGGASLVLIVWLLIVVAALSSA